MRFFMFTFASIFNILLFFVWTVGIVVDSTDYNFILSFCLGVYITFRIIYSR